ncbi:hypothetical protein ACFOU2_10815 [Bacillus songklensis]|uniref:Uncharacterized protein n=1 Tax=Bacillus songklensis TaxID=1069116 RepID=A0ABV8B3U6_9BACI
MREEIPMNRYHFLEKRVKHHMQCLLVKTPEQVVQYFEKRLKKYRDILEKRDVYPESVVVSVQHLIREYSLDITRIKEYMNYMNPHKEFNMGKNHPC